MLRSTIGRLRGSTRRARCTMLAMLLAVLSLVAVAAMSSRSDDGGASGEEVPVTTAVLGGEDPGSLVSAVTVPRLDVSIRDTGANGARITYRSTNGSRDEPTVVSGLVLTPPGLPPMASGWPVIAFGHGTVGINEACAPSQMDDVAGMASYIRGAIEGGYAVVVPDYEGLGTPGVHPYLDSRTAGLNVIDAVRALRSTFPAVSSRWAAFGISQGGAAVWAANEEADTYAPELTLVGTYAMAPAADVSGVVSLAEKGDLSTEQIPLFQWLLVSQSRLDPGFKLDGFRRGAAAENWDLLSKCEPDEQPARFKALEDVRSSDLAPRDNAAAKRLSETLEKWALPRGTLSAPLFVVYGGKDTYVLPSWTTRALEAVCAKGGPAGWQFEPGRGHNDIEAKNLDRWFTERFDGKPFVNQCG